MYDSPLLMASTFLASRSMPTAWNPARASSTAKGRPTYPSPTTPTRAVRSASFLRSVSAVGVNVIQLLKGPSLRCGRPRQTLYAIAVGRRRDNSGRRAWRPVFASVSPFLPLCQDERGLAPRARCERLRDDDSNVRDAKVGAAGAPDVRPRARRRPAGRPVVRIGGHPARTRQGRHGVLAVDEDA